VDESHKLLGAITRNTLHNLLHSGPPPSTPLTEVAPKDPVVAYADEPLRAVVYRMADTGLTRFPVVEREDSRKLVGMVSLNDLLRARTRSIEEERHRERVLRIRLPLGKQGAGKRERPPANAVSNK